MRPVKRVLLVTYFFAPSPAVGATRAVKFYEHLPEFGWEPHVLTICPATGRPEPDLPRVNRTSYLSPWKWLERRQANRPPAPANVPAWSLRQAVLQSSRRRQAYFLLRHVLPMSSVRMPDSTLGWYPFAIRAGLALLRSQPFDAIWSSTGPPTSHLVAARLHQVTGLPWIADYRDLWSQNYQELRLPFFQSLEARLEHRTLAQAARITTISQGLAQVLANPHGRDIDVVYNGYDDTLPLPTEESSGCFSIHYTGTLYPTCQDVRPFFQALRQARLVESDFRPQVLFTGPELSWLPGLAQTYDLSEIIECRSPVARVQALALQQTATALLLFGWQESAGQPGVLPVKMFEYMRTGRPILEIGSPKSESAGLIARCRAGVTVEQPEAIAQTLLTWWREFQQTGRLAWDTDREQVAAFSRRVQTGRLAEILASCSRDASMSKRPGFRNESKLHA
jgi:hypothetical protein